MKLVLDDDGHVVLKDGEDGKKLPVYEYEDGTKKEFDAGATLSGLTKKLTASEEEKQRHFDKAEKLTADLEAFKDIDPKKAKEAFRIVKNLDDKKLLDDKGVEAVKEEVRTTMKNLAQEREDHLKETHAKDRDEWHTKFSGQNKLIRNLVIDNLFANSDYFSGEKPKTIYPADDASQIFGKNFDVVIEDGNIKVEAKDSKGKPIMSKIEHGEPADFNEAIGLIIEKHPRKNEILRSGNAGGPGADGNLDHTDKEFDKMSPAEKIASGLKKHYKETGTQP
jgi:hypothetical protein